MTLFRIVMAATLTSAWLLGSASAQQEYPTRTITIVVPYAVGGPIDTVTRFIADHLGDQLHQQVIIQNYSGAGGTVGTRRVVKAAPDGYTLLSHHIGLSTVRALYKSLSFDPLKDLEPIGLVGENPMAIVARKDFPPNTLQELIQFIRDPQQKITFANAGIGGADFLCDLLFEQQINAKFTDIPYAGSGRAYIDLLAGRTDVMCDPATGVSNYVKQGRLKAYAVTADKRVSMMPDVPTTTEAGLPGLKVTLWYGLYAPAHTPAPVIQRLSKALQLVVQDKTVAEWFAKFGTILATPEQATPTLLRQRLMEQTNLWSPIILKSGVSIH
jgi:tripartite-type tricarboxylate transporter receptor subunit TctC